MRTSQGKYLVTGLVASVFLLMSGCGYFLHPDRVGQTRGRVDPAIVVLDAAALLFGIIPGVVAFAVDISTGTIYLPEGEENVIEKHEERISYSVNGVPVELVEADVAGTDRREIAEQLSAQLDRPVNEDSIQYYQSEDKEARLELRISD